LGSLMRAAISRSLAVVLASAAPTHAATPLALSCLGCHQPTVNAPELPALSRLSRDQIVLALRQARDAPQPGSIMARLVAKLSDGDIDALAVELARPPP